MSKEQSLQADEATTTEAPPSMAVLRRAEIVPSKTNPRTHFDATYLQELANSIRDHKVLQPLLVRRLPAERLQDTFADREPGQPLPTHEIVCGECRWRACAIAGEDEIPVLIRHLTDVQVLQVQLVENLKRQDLHPLEEAEGFERLMKDHGMAVEEIAAKVDKSVSQIYKTLKLLELSAECREEMYSGKLNRSVALLVARSPQHLQAQIAKAVMEPDWQGEPLSFRAAAKLIQDRFMLQLSTAVFNIKDASLVAKAGDCVSCPKRTGANTDLFEDVKTPDTCTDPKCFDTKKVAHHARIAEAAKAKGQTVIQGKEAKELMPNEYSTPKGFTLLDEKQYINGRHQSVRQAIGKENVPTPVVIVNPHTKQAQEMIPAEVANKLLKKAEGQKKATEKNKPLSEKDLAQQFSAAWQDKAVEQIHAAIAAGRTQGITVALARRIAMHFAINLYGEGAARFARLFNVPASKVATSAGIDEFLSTCPDATVGPALLVLMAEDELEAVYHAKSLADYPVLQLIAADAHVDVQAVQAQVKADMKAAAAARKEEQQEKAAPKTPLQKKISARAKKTAAADAKAGIAQALQEEPATANDFTVGQRVQFKMDLKGPSGHLRKVCGREGTIECKHGDRGWMVRYGKGKSDIAGADYTELEHVDAGDDSLGASEILLANGVKLEPQPAWPFPTACPAPAATPTSEPAPNPAAAAWPFPTTPKKSRGKAAAA